MRLNFEMKNRAILPRSVSWARSIHTIELHSSDWLSHDSTKKCLLSMLHTYNRTAQFWLTFTHAFHTKKHYTQIIFNGSYYQFISYYSFLRGYNPEDEGLSRASLPKDWTSDFRQICMNDKRLKLHSCTRVPSHLTNYASHKESTICI